MESIAILVLLTFLGVFVSSTKAYTFYVGGRDGWVLKPREDYLHWASRNRFLINDTLIFKYRKGYDTVLQVDKDDYFNCYKEKPLLALKDGESQFTFDRPGPFYFISGHADSCLKGQRIIIVVLHPRSPPPPPQTAPNSTSPTPAPTPAPLPAAPNTPIPPPAVPTSQPTTSPAPAPAESSATISYGSSASAFGIFLIMAGFGYII